MYGAYNKHCSAAEIQRKIAIGHRLIARAAVRAPGFHYPSMRAVLTDNASLTSTWSHLNSDVDLQEEEY